MSSTAFRSVIMCIVDVKFGEFEIVFTSHVSIQNADEINKVQMRTGSICIKCYANKARLSQPVILRSEVNMESVILFL